MGCKPARGVRHHPTAIVSFRWEVDGTCARFGTSTGTANGTRRIIDRVVELARDRLQDWQFRDRLKAFQKEALSRIEIANERYADTIDRETDRFLEKEGVALARPTPFDEIDVSGDA